MKRQNAFLLLFLGFLLVMDAGANLVGFTGWVSSQSRFLFMAALLFAGILLCWAGWTRLSNLKREMSDQSWLRFLKVELIGAGLIIFLGVGLFLLPEEKREALMKTLHDFVEM